MPAPVTPWAPNTFPTAKSLNLALYTCDGTADNPNGIAFLSYRPMLFESASKAATFTTSAGGVQSTVSTSGTVTTGVVIADTAGYFGQTSDLPGLGYYAFTSAIHGSVGDGVNPGGWMVLSHFAAIKGGSSQTSVSADMQAISQTVVAGSRQFPTSGNDSIPFFCDLVNVGALTWQPQVTIRDSSAVSATTAFNATDSSGETSRLLCFWSGVSSTTQGFAQFLSNGTYNWTAPPGVTSVTVNAWGAGAGGGAGNVSGTSVEFGGGGGGGGEFASGSVGVTPGNNYSPIVGLAGTGGVAPGGTGVNGGNTQFSGDSATVTSHGGTGGGGATISANGTGGAGGTGASGTHFNGGTGANGSTGNYGGGGGSSAGTAAAGHAGSGVSGGSAPTGGGPGGSGGQSVISVLQKGGGTNTAGNPLTITFGSALQAGSTIVVCVNRASTSSPGPSDTAVTLSDGTQLTEISANWQGTSFSSNSLCYAFNVTGGETSYTIGGFGGFARTTTTQFYEVAGLGASPNTDNSNSNVNHVPTTFSVSSTMNGAPDFVVGMVGGASQGQINIPTVASGWNTLPTESNSSSGTFNSMRSGYKITSTTGSQTFSGSFGSGTNPEGDGVIIAGFTASTVSPGNSPLAAPSGAGGGGLASGGNGGAGIDGQLTLTWTGASGGGFGTPPIPAPYANWGLTTTIGTTGAANVNINGSNGITNVVNFLANPPMFRETGTAAQSISTGGTVTRVTFASSSTTSLDNYSGYSSGTYTVQRTGLYLFHGLVCFAANVGGTRQAAATINGTSYWGPGYRACASGETYATKTQIFALNAGDTVSLGCRQDSGSSLNLSTTAATRFFLTWLTESVVGNPANLWNPPDPTFRWASGTQAALLPGLFQQYLGNDLGFLSSVPYLLTYQTSAQSSLTVGSFSTVTMDTEGSPPHSNINGDNYAGWTAGASNNYQAQVPGWYLMVGEMFAQSSSAASATVVAGVAASASGGRGPSVATDWYQALSATSTASVGAGATILGMQYMLAGETVTPQIEARSYAAAYSTLAQTSNGGTFAPHFELVWYSE